MAQSSLVEKHIADGLVIVQALAQSGFDVTAAAWVKDSENDQWSLYIATKYVDDHGITEAYKILIEAFEREPDLWVSPFDVKLLHPDDPIAKDLIVLRGPRPMVPAPYHGTRLGNLAIEEAYIYGPLVAPEKASA